ncbi:hypothetical protein [Cohnella herbarum]|uniref:Uncharacterized protein n=1 Tax=Cohnella herbarum TaxID=2728023 RepID=A0A7Z2VPV4_9BACL|nr:hypothetical protein [Cohnella herbarum]QJD86971.1 hypothetical protein HH215_29890 [Cohnella herbarum]
MDDHKPEWYARLRKGPFGENAFDSNKQKEVESRARAGGPTKSRRRLNPWAVTIAAVAILALAFILIPALSQPNGSDRQAADEPVMTVQYVSDHLRIGLSEEEVKRAFGEEYVGQSVRRDFPREHKEDPRDMSTWSAVDIWRYDYGMSAGYEAAPVNGITDQDGSFDLAGLHNGDIEAQLVIYWKDRVVERVIYKTLNEGGDIDTTQIGPGVEEAPPTDPPVMESPDAEVPPIEAEMPAPNEGIRATGESAYGLFQLRPRQGGDENIQALGAPSCIGQETDLQFAGDYELYFLNRSGDEKLVQQFNRLEMIQRENGAIEFMKLDFPNAEIFLFIPRYTDCHGLEFYAYGVDKESGEASNFTFLNGESTLPNAITSPVNLPIVSDGKLVVEGGRAAGQDGATRYSYVPDFSKHQLVLESEEQIP